jgi:hypothetical protein
MPLRMTSSLGVQGDAYLPAGHWEFAATYRWLPADDGDFFVGTANEPPPPAVQPPHGEPIRVNVHTFTLGLTYAATQRIRLSLGVPFQFGEISFIHDDLQRHTQSVTGLGDVTLTGGVWMFNPQANPAGNLSFGLGVKAPTGSYSNTDFFYTATGPQQRTVDASVQPGDGGWGILLEMQGFLQVLPSAVTYLSASYLLNPKERTDVTASPPPGLPGGGVSPYYWSVPDAYSVRGGLSYTMWPQLGLSATLGGRIDGVPVKDVINGGDTNFRRPGYDAFLDLGLDLLQGTNTFTLNVPVRVKANRKANLIDQQLGIPGGGNLAQFELFLGYTHWF